MSLGGVNVFKACSLPPGKDKERVTNENLFYHRCLGSLDVELNRDRASCPSFNHWDLLLHNEGIDAGVVERMAKIWRSVVVLDTA